MKNHNFNHPRDIAGGDIGQVIRELDYALHRVAEECWPNESTRSLARNIQYLKFRPELTWDLISACWCQNEESPSKTNQAVTEAKKRIKTEFTYAKLHYYAAANAIKEKEESKALTLAIQSTFHLGFLSGHLEYLEKSLIRSEKARKGGETKANIIAKTKNHLMDLLRAPPEDGWKDIPHAVQTLTPAIDHFIETNNYGKVIYDSAEFIVNALSEKGELLDTYLAYHKKKSPAKEASN